MVLDFLCIFDYLIIVRLKNPQHMDLSLPLVHTFIVTLDHLTHKNIYVCLYCCMVKCNNYILLD